MQISKGFLFKLNEVHDINGTITLPIFCELLQINIWSAVCFETEQI